MRFFPLLTFCLSLGSSLLQAAPPVPVLVKDINTQQPGGSSMPRDFIVAGNLLYFYANDGIHGDELWKSDGTSGGTIMVKDIAPRSANSTWATNPVSGFGAGNNLFFAADDGQHGIELWKSDGTAAGTVLLKDINPNLDPSSITGSSPGNFAALGNQIYFTAHVGNENALWTTNGTTEGTSMVINFGAGSGVHSLQTVGNTIYCAYSDSNGGTLWKTDGTAAGTVKLQYEGAISHQPAIVAVGDKVFFTVSTSATGLELWKSNGTPEGTVLVKDINPGTLGSNPTGLRAFGDTLYFYARHPDYGVELWKSDGTENGTVMIKDIIPGTGSAIGGSGVPYITGNTDIVFFAASNGVHGDELWKTDGTEAGTRMVRDIKAGSGGGLFLTPVMIGNIVYFVTDDGIHGRELWKSDGTTNGTHMVADINPEGFSSPYDLRVINNKLFFSAYNPQTGKELYMLDVSGQTSPIVSLNGSNPLHRIASPSAYIDPGASAVDGEDGVLTPAITFNNVLTNTPGEYTVTWSATDSFFMTTNINRVVHVWPDSSFYHWKSQLGTLAGSDLGDQDKNGVVDLIQYGLSLPTSPALPAATVQHYPDGNRLSVSLQRDPSRNDVTIEVLGFDTLTENNGTILASSVNGAPFTGPGYVGGDSATSGMKTVEIRDVKEVNDNQQRYIRFRVTH